MTSTPPASDDRRPSYLASLGGFFRPGHDTAREGAAASSTLTGIAAIAALLALVLVARRRRD